jgi:hypothetical protein
METMRMGMRRRAPNTAINIPHVRNLFRHISSIDESTDALTTALSNERLISKILRVNPTMTALVPPTYRQASGR